MKKASKKTKVLVIMPTLDKCGGIERFFMNYYSHLNESVSVDIITHHCDSKTYKNEIKKRGDRLYILPSFKIRNIRKIAKKTKELFANNQYDAVHCQMANAGFLYLALAKKYNIETRILHSHQCRYADKRINAIRNVPCIKIAKHFATVYAACGEDAGKFMFGKKKYVILNNAIDPTVFRFSENGRKDIRNKYNISDGKVVIGAVGRLVPQKNHEFLIRLLPKNTKLLLLIIGAGPLIDKLKQKALDENVEDRVIFVESTDSIVDYYSAMDLLVMPSIYEGLPFVGVEAQYIGLPCIFSENITNEISISKKCYFLPINNASSLELWNEKIVQVKGKKNELLDKNGKFSIYRQAEALQKIYIGVKNGK